MINNGYVSKKKRKKRKKIMENTTDNKVNINR